MTALPRGIRNNNPGNIRLVAGTRWLGQVPPERQTDREFVQFESEFYGLRALCRVLRTYVQRHNLRTVAEIIGRWAPHAENDTGSYVRFVANEVGVHPDQLVPWEEAPSAVVRLVRAICTYENGWEHVRGRYPDDLILRAAAAAGLLDDETLERTSVAEQLDLERPLGATRTVRGARIATVGTAGTAAVEAIRENIAEAQGAVSLLVPYLGIARWVMLVLVLVGIGAVVWARFDDRRKGLR